jgi:ribosomal protein S18 acetylase RimI-like enzyme
MRAGRADIGRPSIVLLPLTDAEYADFVERQIEETARQHVNAGEWTTEEAPDLARARLADLTADRLRGAGDYFYKGVTAEGLPVGWLWVSPAPSFLGLDPGHERMRWLSQIIVAEALRGQGFGRALLEALHAQLRFEGVAEVWLRVYDWNTVARRLYRALGYEQARKFATDAHLRKLL